MADIEILDCYTRLDIPASRVVDGLDAENIDGIVVAYYDKEGHFNLAANQANAAEILWLLESAKKRLLDLTD